MSSLKYVKERVGDLGAKVIEIYTGSVMDTEQIYPIFNIRESDSADAQLKKFGDNFSGNFTAFLRLDKNQARRSGERIVFYHGGSEEPNKSGSINGSVNLEEARRQWELERSAKERENDLMKKVQDLADELKFLRKPEARLASILEELSDRFNWNIFKGQQKPVQQTISGVTNQNQSAMAHNIDDLTEDQNNKLEEAFATIYSHLGYDLLLRVADALEKKPSLAKSLDAFI